MEVDSRYVGDVNLEIAPKGLKPKYVNFNKWLNKGEKNYSNYQSPQYTGITYDFKKKRTQHNGSKGDIEKLGTPD